MESLTFPTLSTTLINQTANQVEVNMPTTSEYDARLVAQSTKIGKDLTNIANWGLVEQEYTPEEEAERAKQRQYNEVTKVIIAAKAIK